jgi:hypothetical protein
MLMASTSKAFESQNFCDPDQPQHRAERSMKSYCDASEARLWILPNPTLEVAHL